MSRKIRNCENAVLSCLEDFRQFLLNFQFLLGKKFYLEHFNVFWFRVTYSVYEQLGTSVPKRLRERVKKNTRLYLNV